MSYSTYLGGSNEDYGLGIAVDGSGNAYVTGLTYSDDFPTESPYRGNLAGGVDAFVTKLNPAGNKPIYSTYLGGSSDDDGRGIAVDGSGNAYVTGLTVSSDFPTESPYRGSHAGENDAFVTKLNPAGNKPVYSTYLGGSNADYGQGIAVDGSGNAYVTGITFSSDFPTKSPYRGSLAGENDAFVTKMAGDEKSNGGSISGHVLSKSDEPIAGATVKLKDIITGDQQKGITDDKGYFIFFTNLELGTYKLKAKKGKKKSETELITLSEEGQNVNVDLVLDR